MIALESTSSYKVTVLDNIGFRIFKGVIEMSKSQSASSVIQAASEPGLEKRTCHQLSIQLLKFIKPS